MDSIDKNHTENRNLLFVSYSIIGMSLMVLLGWVLDIRVLKSVFPGFVSMKINTAIGFLFSGLAFFLLLKKKIGITYELLAIYLVLFGITSVSQGVLDKDFGIDQFFMLDRVAINNGELYPGRPATMTSLCFVLLGFVFLFLNSKKSFLRDLTLYILYSIEIIAFVALEGYFFNVPVFYKHQFFSSMALHTSLAFLVISIGISFASLDKGFVGLFKGEKMGDIMTQKLFFRMLVSILFLGFVRLEFQRYNLVTEEFGIALILTGFIIIATSLIFSTAKMLNQIDYQRKIAEEEIVLTNKNLETTVDERTRHLQEQNKQLEDFSNIISHNLRGSVGNLDALLYFYKEEETEGGKNDLIEKFETTVGNIETTLNDLLEVISIKHQVRLEREIVVFDSIFSKIKQTFEGEIMKNEAKIVADFSEAPEVEYSSVYLESVMQNLFRVC